jgi:hypothetical protein
MERKQFKTHVTPNMIHIIQIIREQSTNGNEKYKIKLTNTSTYHNLEDYRECGEQSTLIN